LKFEAVPVSRPVLTLLGVTPPLDRGKKGLRKDSGVPIKFTMPR